MKAKLTLISTRFQACTNLYNRVGGALFETGRSGEAGFWYQCPSSHKEQVCSGWSAAGRSVPLVTRIIGKGKEKMQLLSTHTCSSLLTLPFKSILLTERAI